MYGALRMLRHEAPKPSLERDDVVIVGVESDLLRLCGALAGWEGHMREDNGLAWLAERIDELTRGSQATP